MTDDDLIDWLVSTATEAAQLAGDAQRMYLDTTEPDLRAVQDLARDHPDEF